MGRLARRSRPTPRPWSTAGDRIDVLDLVARGLADGTDPSGPWYWGRHRRPRRSTSWRRRSSPFALWTGPRAARAGARSRRAATGARLAGPGPRPRRLRRQLGAVPGHRRDRRAAGWASTSTTGSSTRASTACSRWYAATAGTRDGDGPRLRPLHGLGHPLAPAPLGGRRRRPPTGRPGPRAWRAPAPGCATCRRSPPTDGAIPLFGRSLGYRFATAAPLGLAATLGLLPVDPGQARGIIDRSIRYHLAHDAIDPADRLVPRRRLGRAARRLRALHVGGRVARGPCARSCRCARRRPPVLDGARPGPAAHRRRSFRRRSSDLVLRGPGYLVGRDRRPGRRGSPRRSWTIPTTSPATTTGPSYGKWLFHSRLPVHQRGGGRRARPGRHGAAGGAPTGRSATGAWSTPAGSGPAGPGRATGVAVDGAGTHGTTVVSIRVGRCLGARHRPAAARRGARRGREPAPGCRGRGDDPPAGDERSGVRGRHRRAPLGGHPGARRLRLRPALGGRRAAARTATWSPSTRSSRRSRSCGRRAAPRLLAHWPTCRHRRRGPHPRARGDRGRGRTARTGSSSGLADGEVGRCRSPLVRRARVELGGWTVTGPGLHVVRVGPEGAWFAGEAIAEVAGGPAHGATRPGRASSGCRTACSWARPGASPSSGPGRASPLGACSCSRRRLGAARPLPGPGVLAGGVVREARRRTGHAFVWFQLLP